MLRPTYMLVDLDAIYENVESLKAPLDKSVKFLGVVKGDGYSHGIIPVAKTMHEAGVDYFAVAIAEEGAEMRRAGITEESILVLGLSLKQSFPLAIEYDLTLTVCEKENILQLQETAKSMGKNIKVHIKIDSGMSRIGVRNEAELSEVLDTISKCENIILEGVFTHFATADEEDDLPTKNQIEKFEGLLNIINNRGLKLLVHAANSAATLNYKQTHYDMVRPGVCSYGYYPSDYVIKNVKLKPAFEWHTKIAYLKLIEKGDSVGYGFNYKAEGKRKIATLPVGYADGYRRDIGNSGYVLIRGQKAPVVGKVCMDQCMVDVTDIKDVSIGDDVVLIGKSGKQQITIETMAGWLNASKYEMLAVISKRVPRVYVSDRNANE